MGLLGLAAPFVLATLRMKWLSPQQFLDRLGKGVGVKRRRHFRHAAGGLLLRSWLDGT
eukprot:CAMPEP_0194530362 /NCGR_PEP_ID=MMETSP0253-20130528/67290_1 /TAXON_ID=2966 /ORGANISM="Noctiluca scintillans" /LENGTH=57 /DNA_ID=CAMNT_0039375587 /DNA_START=249 /DNA_END=418 /DNA_ORIENTATION=+